MAGPTAGVLFPRPIDREQLRTVVAAGHSLEHVPAQYAVADPRIVFDAWVDERPFILSQGEEYPGAWRDRECAGFSRTVGWEVGDEVGIAAMCNDDLDHILLGQLCVVLAERFGGMIEFGGCPPTPRPPEPHVHWSKIKWPRSAEAAEAFKTLVAGFPGQLIELPICDDGIAVEATEFFCDATFMAVWLRHPNFRMVK